MSPADYIDKAIPHHAYVVFSGEADLKWLKILKKGFRHCFVLIKSGGFWVLYNPLSNTTELSVIDPAMLVVYIEKLVQNGYRVMPVDKADPPLKMAPLWPYTCVEAVKRILGLHAPWVVTPWQLYRHLKKM